MELRKRRGVIKGIAWVIGEGLGGTRVTWGGMRVRLLRGGGTSDRCGVLGGRGDGISAGEGLDPGEARVFGEAEEAWREWSM